MDEKLDTLITKFAALEARITAIENEVTRAPAHQPAEPEASPVSHSQGPARVENTEESTFLSASPQNQLTQLPNDVCRQFDSIRDRLIKTTLPEMYRVNDSPVGIKQELKPCLKVISKTARHAETGLKLLAGITAPDNETEDGSFHMSAAQAQDLMTIFTSQTAFLQSEYSSLVVKSTFNAETSRIFRQFENNSSAFSESALRNVRLAAELSAIADRQQPRSHFRGQRGGGGAGRFFRGRQRGQNQRGNWGFTTANEIPTRPPHDESN